MGEISTLIFADAVADAARQIISKCKQTDDMQDRVDRWSFCPHYPYPPPGRRWAVGMQGAQIVAMLTHATHANASAEGIDDQWVYSNSVEKPLWRVMLWYARLDRCYCVVIFVCL